MVEVAVCRYTTSYRFFMLLGLCPDKVADVLFLLCRLQRLQSRLFDLLGFYVYGTRFSSSYAFRRVVY